MKTTKKIKPFIITAMIALIAVVVGMGGYTFAKYYTTTDNNQIKQQLLNGASLLQLMQQTFLAKNIKTVIALPLQLMEL